VRLVVIDSLTGYVHAMPDERFLTLHLHGCNRSDALICPLSVAL
jgi:hypothetical protein